jgi:hypothetical protein
MRLAWCLQPFDAAAQGRKHVRACAHAPLPLEMMAVPVSERRIEPEAGSFVHDMFYIKLTAPMESTELAMRAIS